MKYLLQLLDQNKIEIEIFNELKTQTENEPQISDVWYALGQALVGVGDFDGALEAFDRVRQKLEFSRPKSRWT